MDARRTTGQDNQDRSLRRPSRAYGIEAGKTMYLILDSINWKVIGFSIGDDGSGIMEFRCLTNSDRMDSNRGVNLVI